MRISDKIRMKKLGEAIIVSIQFEKGQSIIWSSERLIEGVEFSDAVDALIEEDRSRRPKKEIGNWP